MNDEPAELPIEFDEYIHIIEVVLQKGEGALEEYLRFAESKIVQYEKEIQNESMDPGSEAVSFFCWMEVAAKKIYFHNKKAEEHLYDQKKAEMVHKYHEVSFATSEWASDLVKRMFASQGNSR